MIGRVFMFILMGFLGLIGVSVNFRRDGSHNPFKLSKWGYLFFCLGLLGFTCAVYYQIQDYTDNKNTQLQLQNQRKTDSLQRIIDLQELKARLSDLNIRLDEKQDMNMTLVKQNTELFGSNQKIQNGQVGLLTKSKELLDTVDLFRNQIQLKDKSIDELHKIIYASKRGNGKAIAFDGATTTVNTSHGYSNVVTTGTPETTFFPKFLEAIKADDVNKLLSIANEGIAFSPDWMTPRYFKAIALLNLGDRDGAMSLMNEVEENTYGDEVFTKKLVEFYNYIGDKNKVQQLQQSNKTLH